MNLPALYIPTCVSAVFLCGCVAYTRISETDPQTGETIIHESGLKIYSPSETPLAGTFAEEKSQKGFRKYLRRDSEINTSGKLANFLLKTVDDYLKLWEYGAEREDNTVWITVRCNERRFYENFFKPLSNALDGLYLERGTTFYFSPRRLEPCVEIAYQRALDTHIKYYSIKEFFDHEAWRNLQNRLPKYFLSVQYFNRHGTLVRSEKESLDAGTGENSAYFSPTLEPNSRDEHSRRYICLWSSMRIKATGTTDRILPINDYSKEIRKVHIELLKKTNKSGETSILNQWTVEL